MEAGLRVGPLPGETKRRSNRRVPALGREFAPDAPIEPHDGSSRPVDELERRTVDVGEDVPPLAVVPLRDGLDVALVLEEERLHAGWPLVLDLDVVDDGGEVPHVVA